MRPIYTQLFVKVQKHDAYISNWFNPFKRPYNELCWRMDYSKETVLSSVKRHELISDGTYNIIDYNIRYYKRPSPIIVPTAATFPQFVIDGITVPPGYAGKDCELDSGVHRQIVDIAVRLAVAALQETQEYQVKSIESLKSE